MILFKLLLHSKKTIIDEVIRKLKYYIRKYDIHAISLGGGVAANQYLRKEITNLNLDHVDISELKYTGDQASMIVWYGAKLIE